MNTTTMNPTFDTLRDDCQLTLDRLLAAAGAGLTAPTVMALIERAEAWRRAAPQAWRTLVSEVMAPHPLSALVARCPMTARARDKPRGYAGDAVMLDYIYDRENVATLQLSGDERAVFRTVAESPTCASVDYRRQLIAQRIDTLAARGPLQLLSLACGHARELDLSAALREGAVTRAVMCDQDSHSLEELARRHAARAAVQTRPLTVRQFLARGSEVTALGAFDFVYSAGLYDYLDQRCAQRLTRCLFERVAPGGQLLLANFHPANRGTGYMEAFMDWWLIYRDEAQMQDLCAEISPSELVACEIECDPFGNVVYLSLTRRAA